MKGAILLCIKEMVIKNYGYDKWTSILSAAGIHREPAINPISDIEDSFAMSVIKSMGTVLGLIGEQVGDAFGDYWVNHFAPRLYSFYYKGYRSAREFILDMDRIHDIATRDIINAHPPKFDFKWADDKRLIITYRSARQMIDICVGLIKGVGRYYHEDLKAKKLDEKTIEVIFP